MIEKITGRVWKLGDNIDSDAKLSPLPWGERVRVRGNQTNRTGEKKDAGKD